MVKLDKQNSKNWAFVLVDMQDEFLDVLNEERRDILIQSNREMLRYCSDNNILIVILEFLGYGATVKEISEVVKYAKRVEIIGKGHDDGFIGTQLDNTLKKEYIKNITTGGVSACSCVKYTANHAMKNKYGVYTAKQLIADPDCPRKPQLFQESLCWYSWNCNYREDYKDLFKIMQ